MKAAMAIVVSDEQRAMLNPRMGVLQEAPMSIIISIKQNHIGSCNDIGIYRVGQSRDSTGKHRQGIVKVSTGTKRGH
jgi:hypothetical protein